MYTALLLLTTCAAGANGDSPVIAQVGHHCAGGSCATCDTGCCDTCCDACCKVKPTLCQRIKAHFRCHKKHRCCKPEPCCEPCCEPEPCCDCCDPCCEKPKHFRHLRALLRKCKNLCRCHKKCECECDCCDDVTVYSHEAAPENGAEKIGAPKETKPEDKKEPEEGGNAQAHPVLPLPKGPPAHKISDIPF